jgi:hypothetical protein
MGAEIKMETSVSWIFWLFPVVFAIHNLEEAVYLPHWSKSAGKFHKPVGAFEFSFAVIVLTAISVVITIVFYMTGRQSIASYLFFAFNFGMLFNVFFPHLAATIVLNKYCPGLLTGVALLVPATSYLLFYGYDNEFYSFPKFWFITIPFAVIVIVLIPILFKIGKLLQHGENNHLCIKK